MRLAWVVMLLFAIAGCGSSDSSRTEPPGVGEIPDTIGLSEGPPLLSSVESRREGDGSLRFRGNLDVPDGTRIQLSLYRKKTNEMMSRLQMTVQDRRFESPPIVGSGGPLPKGEYRVEYLAHFNSAWQPPSVLEATDDGRRLRGPGITRDRTGQGALFLVEERRL